MDHRSKIQGTNSVISERIKDDESLKEATAILMQAMSDEDGLSRSEFENEEAVVALLKRWPSYVFKALPEREIVGVNVIVDSLMVRGENPIYGGGYIAVKHEAKGKGIAGNFIKTKPIDLFKKHGYVATLSRQCVVTKMVLVSPRAGLCYIGIIPNSLYLPKFGWVDDLIEYSLVNDDWKNIPILNEQLVILPLKHEISMMKYANNKGLLQKEYPFLVWNEQSLSVQEPNLKDVLEVEEMIREAAREGQGFALDEFNSDGFMNRRLLYKNHMLVVKSQKGTIKAGLVFGPSTFCRTIITTQVGGYMVVRKAEREKGLGKALLKYCVNNMGHLGYTAILTDVFVTNKVMLGLLERESFIVTGTLPHSGIVKGNGRTNTYIMYKPRVKHKISQAVMLEIK